MKRILSIFSFLLLIFYPLFFSILIMFTLSDCTTTEEALETEQEIPKDKKVTLDQEIDEDETSVSSNEETQGNKQHSPVLGQSEERCYVDADATKSEFDPTLLSNISVSLISEFLKEVEPLPPAGLPMDACVYLIGSVTVKDTTFVTFKGKNLNSFGNSKLPGPDGFQEAVLNALYRALEDKRKLICDAYGEYIEKCGGTVKKIPADKMVKIQEMKNEYDQLGKKITVLDTRIERMNSTVVADNLILEKGTLFFHYLNYQWGWFMNSNGDKFEGEYFGEIVSLKPHGTGILTYPNGFKSGDGKIELRGEWKEGEPWNVSRHNKSGEITGKWVNGVMTDSEFVVMKKSQKGILFRVNSNSKFVKGGKKWFKSGDEKTQAKYEGEIVDGVPAGLGTLSFFNGNKYVGEWKDGEPDGTGTFTWSDGHKYVGEFKDGKRNGLGTYTRFDGPKYVGEWKDDDRHGQGRLTSPEGWEYIGEFKDGLQNGQGTTTSWDGSKFVGEHKDTLFFNGTEYDKIGIIKSKIVNGNRIKQ